MMWDDSTNLSLFKCVDLGYMFFPHKNQHADWTVPLYVCPLCAFGILLLAVRARVFVVHSFSSLEGYVGFCASYGHCCAFSLICDEASAHFGSLVDGIALFVRLSCSPQTQVTVAFLSFSPHHEVLRVLTSGHYLLRISLEQSQVVIKEEEFLEKDRKIEWSATKKIECYVDILLHDNSNFSPSVAPQGGSMLPERRVTSIVTPSASRSTDKLHYTIIDAPGAHCHSKGNHKAAGIVSSDGKDTPSRRQDSVAGVRMKCDVVF